MKFVIMCGGSGSKLWPVSRDLAPKQFLPIVGKKTMFQLNVEALLERYSAHDIYVSTSDELQHFVEEQAPEIPKENYIIEPKLNKDTGPASCYAMAKVAAKHPDDVVYFYVQSPIIRTPSEKYLDMIEGMEQLVLKHNKLVTGTQIPKYTETGSDLMQLGAQVEAINGLSVYEIEKFFDVVKDRWTKDEVVEVSEKHRVGTHTNHYTWRPEPFFEAVKKYRPDWYKVTQKLLDAFGKPNEQELINKIYSEYEPGRAELLTRELMNNNQVIAVVVPYRWAHITTWDDVYRYYLEENIETHQTEVIEIQKDGNLVLSSSKKLVALVGIENMVIIETDDALLICPRDQANKVKEVNDILKTRGYKELL